MKKVKYVTAFLMALSLSFSLTLLSSCNTTSDSLSEFSSESVSMSDETLSEETVDSEEAESAGESSSESFSSSSSQNSSNQSSSSSKPNSSSSSNQNSSSSSQSSSSAAQPEDETSYTQYIRCTGDNVNIRSGAGTNYSVLGSAEKGTMYAIIGKTGSWYKTYYRNQVAYIYASYASVFTLEDSQDEDVEDVLSEGYKLIGVPYVYGAVRVHDGNGKLLGGFNAQKFDCSSLVQYVFNKGAGTLLQSHTRTQVKQGKYVSKNNIQRGDCLFFTNEDRQYNTGIERVGHVAIYLGDNYILHTASDYARIEKISASRWKFFIEARRFL